MRYRHFLLPHHFFGQFGITNFRRNGARVCETGMYFISLLMFWALPTARILFYRSLSFLGREAILSGSRAVFFDDKKMTIAPAGEGERGR